MLKEFLFKAIAFGEVKDSKLILQAYVEFDIDWDPKVANKSSAISFYIYFGMFFNVNLNLEV